MHRIRLTRQKVGNYLQILKSTVTRESNGLDSWRAVPGWPADGGCSLEIGDGTIISEGEYWGGLRRKLTLFGSFSVPPGLRKENLRLDIQLGTSPSLEPLSFLYGPEALVFIDGDVVQGLNPHHTAIDLADRFRDGERHSIVLKTWTGIKDEKYRMGPSTLQVIDQSTADFATAIETALGVVDGRDDSDPVTHDLLDLADRTLAEVDFSELRSPGYYAGVRRALASFRSGLEGIGRPLNAEIGAVGHAHLDLAWLWPLEQTREKAARTFSTVLNLIEKNDDFFFSQSQPQLYDYIKRDYPELFERIRKAAEAGRWEILGGMWVEADCNISGAESLVRQFLLGRDYYRRYFPVSDSPVLWLPDVFGYSWQLPQIMKQCGIEFFVTAKLSWNQYNRMPYDTFRWKGLDGSEVMTQFITTKKPGWWGATYSADLDSTEVLETWKDTRQKCLNKKKIYPFGQGDGGGGPTQEMIDRGRLMKRFPGLPEVRFTKVHEYLRDLYASFGNRLPEWNGELYLELHRGTYTTQARNKKNNRKSEILMHDLEFLATWAWVVDENYEYPADDINDLWKTICLNQFHDIIPGSSIREVYDDSDADYRRIFQTAETIREKSLAVLDNHMSGSGDVLMINPTSFHQSRLVENPDEPGTLMSAKSVPPYGWKQTCLPDKHDGRPSEVYVGHRDAVSGLEIRADAEYVIGNGLLHVELDGRGEITRLLDRRNGREILEPGEKSNQWILYEDRPLDWDAWDIEIYHDERPRIVDELESIAAEGHHSLRGRLRIARRFGANLIEQSISLDAESLRLDFDTRIHWEERHRLLKVQFPTTVMNTVATYDIQWGNVERPTHTNTSWDWARFESCAHKWVDLSEGDYGVSLLNDGKYGFSVKGPVIQMSVLRGPVFPDPTADVGDHRFRYSLLMHRGTWREATIAEAYALNEPLIVRSTRKASSPGNPLSPFFVKTDHEHSLIIETIKRSEDGNGVVLRLYECHRTRGVAMVECGFDVGRAWAGDMMERKLDELECRENQIRVPFQPYRIITLIIETGRVK